MDKKRLITALSLVLLAFAIAVTVAIVFPYKAINAASDRDRDHDSDSHSSADFNIVDNADSSDGHYYAEHHHVEDFEELEDFADTDDNDIDDVGDGDVDVPAEAYGLDGSTDRNEPTQQESNQTIQSTEQEVQSTEQSSLNEPTDEQLPSQGNNVTEVTTNQYLDSLVQKESYSKCYTPLYLADANLDGVLNGEEYAEFIYDFINLQGEGNGTHVIKGEGFADLPYIVQVNFLYLSCLCDGCCEESQTGICIGDLLLHIGTDNTGNNSTENNSQQTYDFEKMESYLDNLCDETRVSLDLAQEEEIAKEEWMDGDAGGVEGGG